MKLEDFNIMVPGLVTTSPLSPATLPHPALIVPLLAFLALNPLLPLSATLHPDILPFVGTTVPLLPHSFIIQLDQPLPFLLLIRALEPPPLDPFTTLLIVHQILASVLRRGTALQTASVLADAFFPREHFPLGGRFGLGEGFPPR